MVGRGGYLSSLGFLFNLPAVLADLVVHVLLSFLHVILALSTGLAFPCRLSIRQEVVGHHIARCRLATDEQALR